MRVLVWGMGYIGTVSAACLASLGHEVIGIEPDPHKVRALNEGCSVIHEPGLDELIKAMTAAGKLKASQDGESLVGWADLSLICVGTPSDKEGAHATDALEQVAASIGRGMAASANRHTITLRSTVSPGTTQGLLRHLLERHSGKVAGKDFGLTMNPEFLREAVAVKDFYAPPYIIIGEWDTISGDTVDELYKGVNAEVYRIGLNEAETLKLLNNAFHSLKIGFANEIARFCEPLEMDSHLLMRLVCADTKLNISPAYLRPGFAFGGSCLPKDLRSLVYTARTAQVNLPIIESILPSNRLHIESACQKIRSLNSPRVGVLGVSFKPGTDDLRESPIIELLCALQNEGFDVRAYDPDVQLTSLFGANRAYLKRRLPDFEQILCADIDELFAASDTIAVCQRRPDFDAATATRDAKNVLMLA